MGYSDGFYPGNRNYLRIPSQLARLIRSGLKIIRGRAGCYFCAVWAKRSVVDRMSMSDEQRRNAQKLPRPYAIVDNLETVSRIQLSAARHGGNL